MNYLEKNKKNFISDLNKLIGFETYLNQKKKYPNEEIKDALNFVTSLAKEIEGFKIFIDPDGYYGYMEIGKGEELIGILAHIDVVPPGDDLEKWNYPPFKLTVKDDKLYGRGTQDDKGPLLLSFYLLKELNETYGKNLNKRIRLIFPTDEESFWRGVNKYKENGEELPNYGFTPDATFPGVFLERELWEFLLKGKPTKKFTLNSGGPLNIVPDKVVYTKNENEIIVQGKAAHAMEPWEGENAISKIIKTINEDDDQLISFIKTEINDEVRGETLFDELIKDEYETLSVNLGMINIDINNSVAGFNLRIPTTSNAKELKKKIISKIEKKYSDLELVENDWINGVYIKESDSIVQKFKKAYGSVMNINDVKMVATGGATYARAMKNILAFGPFFPDSPVTEHQYNEYVFWKDFVKAYDIYNKLFSLLLN